MTVATSVSGGPDRVTRAYDFRLPESIDRAHLRGLRLLFEVFTHRASGVMSARLRTRVSVTLGELEQRSWDDFVASLPETTCLMTVALPPLNGRVVLHLPLPLAMALVDLTLGGTGRGSFPDRALSDIEQQLIGEVAEGIIEELPTALAAAVSVHTSSLTQITSVQFLPAVRLTDMCLQVALTIELGEELTYPFSLCFPFAMIHPIGDALSREDVDESPSESADANAVLMRVLEAPVEVSIQFPSAVLTPVEFLGLTAGDVIRFPYERNSPLALTAGGVHHLDVLPITRGKRLACVVTDSEEHPS